MDHTQLLNDFLDKCQKNNITTYNAKLETDIDHLSLENDDFINFCKANIIKTVFIEKYSEIINTPINLESLKENFKVLASNKLTHSKNYYFFENTFYKSSLGEYYKPLADDYYDSAISRVLKELDSDVSDYNNNCNNNAEKEFVYSIIAYAAYNGVLISTKIFLDSENDYDGTNSLTENNFLNIYSQKLDELLVLLRNAADRDYRKTEQLRQNDLKKELETRIRNDQTLPLMNTKKLRLQYANKLIEELDQTEKYYFLNKTAVRDLVEAVYSSLSQS